MIIACKNGRRYEITQEDQGEILLLAIKHGDVQRAIEKFHLKKYGELLDKKENEEERNG
jgi:hypothetical protein